MTPRRRGLTLIELLVAIGVVAALVGLLLPAIQQARSSALRAECGNHLRQIGLGLHAHHDAFRALPPGTSPAPGATAFQSWRVSILPYLEQTALAETTRAAFRAQKNFFINPPHVGLTTVVPVLLCPAEARTIGTTPEGHTAAFSHYLGVSGGNYDNGMLFYNSKIRFADVTDGLAQTLMVGERPPSVDAFFGWWYAGVGQQSDGDADNTLNVRAVKATFRRPTCELGPYHFAPGDPEDPCADLHFWSPHRGGANFLMGDASVQFMRHSADPILPALASRAGGESPPAP